MGLQRDWAVAPLPISTTFSSPSAPRPPQFRVISRRRDQHEFGHKKTMDHGFSGEVKKRFAAGVGGGGGAFEPPNRRERGGGVWDKGSYIRNVHGTQFLDFSPVSYKMFWT